MNENEKKMLFGVMEEIEEEYYKFNLDREESRRLSFQEYLLLRSQALDMVRMENSNRGDLFTIPDARI